MSQVQLTGIGGPFGPESAVHLNRNRRSIWAGACTFAWLERQRRMTRDYEALPLTEEEFVYAAMCRLMLRRLVCKASPQPVVTAREP